MTTERPGTAPDEDPGPAGPGPGVRWSGDGSLAPRRAPRWGSDTATAEPQTPVEAPAALPGAIAGRQPTVDGMVLAGVPRRLGAFFLDLAIKMVILAISFAFSGVEFVDPRNVPVGSVVAATVLNFGYAFLFGISGLSPGQRILKIRIVALDGRAPGTWRSLVRAVSSLNETLLYLSSAWILVDRRRQALHDKAAGTIMIMRPEAEDAPRA